MCAESNEPLLIKTNFGKSADFPNGQRPSHSLYTVLATGFLIRLLLFRP
jgi:hypothetical protein